MAAPPLYGVFPLSGATVHDVSLATRTGYVLSWIDVNMYAIDIIVSRILIKLQRSDYTGPVNPYFEKIAAGPSSFVAYERSDPAFPFYWHYHPEYELTLIVDSHGQRLVGDSIDDYGSGDLVLLGPNLPHSWRSGPVKPISGETHRA